MTRLEVEVSGNLAFSFRQYRRYLRSFFPLSGRARKKASLRVETEGRLRVLGAARRSSVAGAGAEPEPAQATFQEAASG